MQIYYQLSLTLVAAAVLAGVMRVFKQPIIVGYVLTGLLLGPQFLNLFKAPEEVAVFSQMGITTLLFIVGLHLSPTEIKDLGKPTFIVGVLQVLLTSLFAFGASAFLGFTMIESVYFGGALAFSSTIIVLKLLTDKKDLEKLYGRISIGILLLQDIVAAVALVVASAFASSQVNPSLIFLLLIKLTALVLVISLVAVYILPRLGNFFAKSLEYLFLFSLAWGLGLATLFKFLGFSVEIGALIAGIALSFSPYSSEVSARLKPLRDFFVIIFFILIGAQITFKDFYSLFWPVLGFLAFILFVKPLIVLILMSALGYNKKTSFLSAISLGQISEFSMILVMLGVSLGHVRPFILSLVTLLGFLSISVSTYFILFAEKLYPKLLGILGIFERKELILDHNKGFSPFEVVLFGCNRVGFDFIHTFKHLGKSFLAVDFDPETIKELSEKGINCKYGDAEDSDFLDDINVSSARIVVSTIPDFETNLFLIAKVRTTNANTVLVTISYSVDDALKLYEAGATYVILPHFISGEIASKLAVEADMDILRFKSKREDHINYLRERKLLGHAHPVHV